MYQVEMKHTVSAATICLCLPGIGIKGVYHHTQLLSFFPFNFKNFNFKPAYIFNIL